MIHIKFLVIFLFSFLTVFSGSTLGDEVVDKEYRTWLNSAFPASTYYRPKNFSADSFSTADYDRVIQHVSGGKADYRTYDFLMETLYAYYRKYPEGKKYDPFKETLHDSNFVYSLLEFVHRTEVIPPKKRKSFMDYFKPNKQIVKSVEVARPQKGELLHNYFKRDKWAQFYALKLGLISNDKELMVLMAREHGDETFSYANEKLLDDREFVLTAFKSNLYSAFRQPAALSMVSKRLRDDKELVIVALNIRLDRYSETGLLKYASERLRGDRDVVLAAINADGEDLTYANSLKFASEDLKNDKELVLKAVSNERLNLEFASDALKDDQEVILAAVNSAKRHNLDDQGSAIKAYQHASDRLKKDKSFTIFMVTKSCWAAEYLDPSLKKDKELALLAVQQAKEAMRYFDDDLRQDKDIKRWLQASNSERSQMWSELKNKRK